MSTGRPASSAGVRNDRKAISAETRTRWVPGVWPSRLALVAFAVFGAIAIDAALRAPGGPDLTAMKAVQQIDHPHLGPRLEVLERLTDSSGAVVAWAVALVLCALFRWWVPALGILAIPLGGVVNETISRVLIERTRPHLDELRHVSQNFEDRSFPSGHVVGAVLLYGFIWYVVGERVKYRAPRWTVRLFAGAIILLTGFDRVWSGAHWPSDVIGGWALGIGLLTLLVMACQWIEHGAAQLRSWEGAWHPLAPAGDAGSLCGAGLEYRVRRLLATTLRPFVLALAPPVGSTGQERSGDVGTGR